VAARVLAGQAVEEPADVERGLQVDLEGARQHDLAQGAGAHALDRLGDAAGVAGALGHRANGELGGQPRAGAARRGQGTGAVEAAGHDQLGGGAVVEGDGADDGASTGGQRGGDLGDQRAVAERGADGGLDAAGEQRAGGGRQEERRRRLEGLEQAGGRRRQRRARRRDRSGRHSMLSAVLRSH
jgi:hypothetical protein